MESSGTRRATTIDRIGSGGRTQITRYVFTSSYLRPSFLQPDNSGSMLQQTVPWNDQRPDLVVRFMRPKGSPPSFGWREERFGPEAVASLVGSASSLRLACHRIANTTTTLPLLSSSFPIFTQYGKYAVTRLPSPQNPQRCTCCIVPNPISHDTSTQLSRSWSFASAKEMGFAVPVLEVYSSSVATQICMDTC